MTLDYCQSAVRHRPSQGTKISNLPEFGKHGTLSQTAPVWIGQLYLVHNLNCFECTDMCQYDRVGIRLNMSFHNG